MKDLVIVYITNPSLEKAQEIAQHLLQKRLIACANIIPSDTMYWWKGIIEKNKEAILIAKTIDHLYEQVRQEVNSIHSYTVPCIIKIPINANKAYATFVSHEVIKE